MELNLVSSAMADQNGVEVDDFINNDGNIFGGERCGICMDIIIDRGVLDCCQHWFCFGCIDNWATITNLCPLCQNEFQLITCVPVYDTIGSSKADEDTYSRDEDWFIEGKNNTLSFPSYYIDENAVICLDGDGCKIRNGTVTSLGDSNLDTSIACDSCDLWYHAFCVGFDPEGTSENTWICPRCTDEMPQNPDENFIPNCNNPSGFGNPNRELLAEETYSGKVSISVADSGETAIVISMIGGNKLTEEPLDNTGETVTLTSKDDDQKLTKSSDERSATQPVKPQELELSLACDTSLSFSSKSLVKNELVTSDDKSINDHSSSDLDLHLCLSMGTFSSVDEVNESVIEDQSNETMKQHNPSEDLKLAAEKSMPEAGKDGPEETGVKRKHSDDSVNVNNGDTETETVYEVSPKKLRAEEIPGPFCPKDPVNVSTASSDSEISSQVTMPNDEKADIMSIVQGTKRRSSKGPKRTITNDKSSKDVENLAGLRVKKIMKRASEDKESSTLVQNLRNEIREAVRNKTLKDLGENLFDPKLLAAFRAAVAGPKTESVKMLSQMAVKAKKSMLQKGKVRENLTKKIYSSSNGKRKRAWDRDCEIEFWKHRCMRASKPEKIQTLKSVLDLLRSDSEGGTEMGQRSESQTSDPILSRLYLADTSVFPRKDDIKPLAVLKTCGDSEPTKVPPTRQAEGSSVSSSNSAKSIARKETSTVKSTDIKLDKRKWALEVLARRTSSVGDSSASERQGDNDGLNGNYPLLARLPVDMRPVLAPSRHNKIPMSVRQTQLYRLTEHLLRKANLPVIHRTAETELAVADAINIEKKVADRSNSKPVYLNLCSQELLHYSENSKFREAQENDSSVQSTTDPVEKSAEQSENELIMDPTVQEALKNAGLLSDSPPNSPDRGTEVQGEEEVKPLTNTKDEEEGPNDVFEMDNAPDLDIYGEFEYSLDDEDYIGVSATSQFPKAVQSEEGALKMKLVFSTLINSDGPSNNADSDNPNNAKTENQTDAGSTMEVETDSCCIPQESLYGKEGEDPCIAECEELYGPDKEPLVNKLPAKLDEFNDKSASIFHNSAAGETSPNRSETGESVQKKEKKSNAASVKHSESSISKKVEAYIKEHIRPLCKSGIITVEQYRWAVAKTSEKVMKYHCKAKNANFLIKEGEKVKKLAEQYVESAQHRDKR